MAARGPGAGSIRALGETWPDIETALMRAALGLARRGLGRVAPNPAVGCVLTQGQGAELRIVGRGWTQPGGRPHAETEALGRAGAEASGGTAFVTLEPCAHHGKTPPCADALIAAGVARVVVAAGDPDPRVAGRGIAKLEAAGIEVATGLLAAEATALNAGFLARVGTGRPLFTLKLATSIDGKIATSSGESQWITGPEARRRGHWLRRSHDAVMVGSGTVLADDPALDVRIAGLEDPPPVRIVVDARLRTPLTSKLLRAASRAPVILATLEGSDAARQQACRASGAEILLLPPGSGGSLELHALAQALGLRGLTRILVEGGATLAAGLLAEGLVDRIAWFRAPALIGGDGLAAVAGFGVAELAQMPRFVTGSYEPLGEDRLESFARCP